MNNVIDFTARRYKDFARKFVEYYKAYGVEVANAYFNDVIGEVRIPEIKPYIDREMKKHGYRPAHRELVKV